MANHFDEKYDIRLATPEDIPQIMYFIGTYWRKNHLLSRDREFFEYCYQRDGKVYFVIAIDKDTNQIEAVFGYLPTALGPNAKVYDTWGSLWKANSDRGNLPLLGLELAKRVGALSGCRDELGNGMTLDTTGRIEERVFKRKVVRMEHFYMLNPQKAEFKIAVINKSRNAEGINDTDAGAQKCSKDAESATDPRVNPISRQVNPIRFNTMDELKVAFDVESLDVIPYKDNEYLSHRYFEHPRFTYEVWGLPYDDGAVGALLMTRVVEANGAKVLRIVDYIGDEMLLAGTRKFFTDRLVAENLEYVDFYEYGLTRDYILEAGFADRYESENIIPQYFDPFEQRNVDMWSFYCTEGTRIFKADGDQDRPNT